MELIDKFSLQVHEGEYESWPLKSILYYCGLPLEKKVNGYFIDKQYELSDYFLLFINWDCPFEESCEIVVLNKLKKVVGQYSIGSAYNSYNLHSISVISNHCYKLVYSNNVTVELCVNYPKNHWFSKVVKVKHVVSK